MRKNTKVEAALMALVDVLPVNKTADYVGACITVKLPPPAFQRLCDKLGCLVDVSKEPGRKPGDTVLPRRIKLWYLNCEIHLTSDSDTSLTYVLGDGLGSEPLTP